MSAPNAHDPNGEPFPRHPLQTPPPPKPHTGRIPNTPLAASLLSFLLGAVCALGAATFFIALKDFVGAVYASGSAQPGFAAAGRWWPLGFFAAAWSAFHWGEYAVTAGWNFEKCSVDSFLLENGATYHIAHGTAVAEYLLTLYLKPSLKTHPYVSLFGIALVVVGQTLRSAAMITASTNFSHALAFRKRASHTLVTDGVYAWFRHPSYAGFFYWALGTQLVLQNPVSFVAYAGVMWRFFYIRTRAEERALVVFFGDAYVQYRKRVGTMIPFVP
ncbi:Isoprenylcysteine carboxyl methyltransferase family-domain-containing protein [Mycena crocata]|nr:Isoprenylcysteine carboxyl methyltransferase family-domain-containing protein [Mycena crocata]